MSAKPHKRRLGLVNSLTYILAGCSVNDDDGNIIPPGAFLPAAERYKANARSNGLIGYVSADGIHWSKLRDEVIVPSVLENHFEGVGVAQRTLGL